MTKSLHRTLERVKNLGPRHLDLGLERTLDLLKRLGNPQDKLPPVIIVGGTNGKGSTVALLRAMLEAAGLRVHVNTSPHLVRPNERIRLAAPGGGQLISDDHFVELLEECERVTGAYPISFFEIKTVAALLAFSRQPADVVLLEVGLGGRLDATNVIKRPAASVVTRLSYDHCHLLGNTLTAIAQEKAGIFRAGVPAVLFPQPDAEAKDALLREATAVGAATYVGARDWSVQETADGFTYKSKHQQFSLPAPALPGSHQILNAGTAIAVLEQLPFFSMTEKNIAEGLRTVCWPGRLQRLSHGPLAEMLPASWELWLDGGHNDSGGEVLGEHVRRWQDRPTLMVYGMLKTKKPAEFLAPLKKHVHALCAIAIPGDPSAIGAEDAAAAAQSLDFASVQTASGLAAALWLLRDTYGAQLPQARVLICGSLHLAGVVLAENGTAVV